jgi:hypothetical protein
MTNCANCERQIDLKHLCAECSDTLCSDCYRKSGYCVRCLDESFCPVCGVYLRGRVEVRTDVVLAVPDGAL